MEADFIIVGAGIAGASMAHWLAPHARVIVLEREPQPGYHSTGRSAALFIETYGPAQVRALTRASRAFFESPGPGFAGHPLLAARGTLCVASRDQERLLEEYWEHTRASGTLTQRLDPARAGELVPVLKVSEIVGAVYEPDACDMDVHAIHQGFLRGLCQHGGHVVCNAEVRQIERFGANWEVRAGSGPDETTYCAPVVINAAGAWADTVARLAGAEPLGVQPMRRSAFIFAPPEGIDASRWPAVLGAADDWYFKPEAGMLLGSPANVDPVEPHDVQAEEMDVALAIDRIESFTTLQVRRPARVWAGLRSFVADGSLVGGFDTRVSGFFWLAAQGGYGIQTSAAMGEACAALVRGLPLPQRLRDFGLSAEMLGPQRLETVAEGVPQSSPFR
jgi:D-arginine dehydrogenase